MNLKNKCKYLIFAILIVSLVISISQTLVHYTKKVNAENIKFEKYVVQKGDTLWEIANNIMPSKDPRKVINIIEEKNKITPLIHENQVILVPKN